LIEYVRWSVLVCFAACASSAADERSTAKPIIAASRPTSAPSLVEPPPISGTHGAPIVLIAITSEGDAVVSADKHGSIRVWPSLDGSREPFVVHGQLPSELAIAHEGDGFLVANVDVANGLELIRIDRTGRVRGRATPRGEAVNDVVMVGGAALVLRADQSVELIDGRGESVARLVPDAGTRLRRLVAVGDRALAIGDHGPKQFARWIEPGASGWGSTVSGLALDPTLPVAASPDRKYMVSNLLGVGAMTDLVTGKPGPSICGAGRKRSIALGFIDADTIACLNEGRLTWWSISTVKIVGVDSLAPVGDVVGHDVVVSRAGHDLVVRRRDGAKHLGYRTRSNGVVRFSSGGITIATARRSLIIDNTLHARTSVAHTSDEGLLLIDDGFAIAVSAPKSSSNDTWGSEHDVSVFDIAKAETHQMLTVHTSDALSFEPATKLLATIDGANVRLLRYDPKTHMFGAPITVTTEGVIHRLALLDPALSGGLVGLTIEERATGAIIGELDARDLGGTSIKPRRTYRVEGGLLGSDRAGRVYAFDLQGNVRMSKGDGVGSAIVAAATSTTEVIPNADGSRLVLRSPGQIALHLADGTLVWRVPARDVRELGWLGADLVASFADALVRFDLATGEFAARQCGWDFGLHDILQPESPADTQNVCDAD
jgi:hypothetical protein